MVKQQKNNTRKKRSSKGFKANRAKARKIEGERRDVGTLSPLPIFGAVQADSSCSRWLPT